MLKDGRQLHRYIEHAIGSVEVPMTDKQLETKFSDLAEGIIPAADDPAGDGRLLECRKPAERCRDRQNVRLDLTAGPSESCIIRAIRGTSRA